jgi:hypothetical protein
MPAGLIAKDAKSAPIDPTAPPSPMERAVPPIWYLEYLNTSSSFCEYDHIEISIKLNIILNFFMEYIFIVIILLS